LKREPQRLSWGNFRWRNRKEKSQEVLFLQDPKCEGKIMRGKTSWYPKKGLQKSKGGSRRIEGTVLEINEKSCLKGAKHAAI